MSAQTVTCRRKYVAVISYHSTVFLTVAINTILTAISPLFSVLLLFAIF